MHQQARKGGRRRRRRPLPLTMRDPHSFLSPPFESIGKEEKRALLFRDVPPLSTFASTPAAYDLFRKALVWVRPLIHIWNGPRRQMGRKKKEEEDTTTDLSGSSPFLMHFTKTKKPER